MNADQPLAIVSEHPYSQLSGENAIRSLALAISQTSLPCDTPKEALDAIDQIEQQWKAPLYDLRGGTSSKLNRLISIVRYLRQVDTVPAIIATDNSPSWDSSRDEIDTDLVLSASECHNIGMAFQEYREELLRFAISYFRHEIGIARAIEAGEWTVSECCAYAVESVSSGKLDTDKLFERRTWCGILRRIRSRYYREHRVVSIDGCDREAITLEDIIGRQFDTDYTEWSADELDYIIGIDDNTPDWAIDTIAALLASPDGTDDERAALLKIRPAAYRKRLQRTREYFSTRD